MGDTLPITYINYDPLNYVASIDSVLIGSQYRKRYNINNFGYGGDAFVSLIEGVGGTYGLLQPLEIPYETYRNLICFTNNGESTQFDEQFLYVGMADNDMNDCNLIYLGISSNNYSSYELDVFPNPADNFITSTKGK